MDKCCSLLSSYVYPLSSRNIFMKQVTVHLTPNTRSETNLHISKLFAPLLPLWLPHSKAAFCTKHYIGIQPEITSCSSHLSLQLASQQNSTCHMRCVWIKLYLCSTNNHVMKTYWENGGIAPRILNLITRWR